MKIKEICEKTGLTDKAVRFYIQEQLIAPFYTENYLGRKSFDFSEQDLKQLENIATLRSFGFTVEEIRELLSGKVDSQQIVASVKKRTEENFDDIKYRHTVLSELDASEQVDIELLVRQLSGTGCAVKNESARMSRRSFFAVFKSCLMFLAVWLPIMIAISILLFRFYVLDTPTISPIFFVCTFLCFFPSTATILFFRRLGGARKKIRVILIGLCVICLPLGAFFSAKSVIACEHKYQAYRTTVEATCQNGGEVVMKCKSCGDFKVQSVEKLSHKAVAVEGIVPTCSISGISEGSVCLHCDTVLVEQRVLPQTNIHTPVVIGAAVAATCKDTGLTEGSRCSVCNKTLAAQTVVPVTNDHTPVIDVAVSATCKDTGLTEGSHCSVCSKVLVAQTVAPKTEDHMPVIDVAVSATCKDTGLTEGSHCSVCNKTLVAQTVVPKTEEHTPVTDAAVPASCKNTGLTEGSHCFVCNKVLVAQNTVPKTEDHTPVTDAAVSATCKATGLTEGSHCSVCDKVLIAQTTVPKTEDHTPVTDAAVPATCKDAGLTEGSHCSVCNKIFVEQTVVPRTNDHSYMNGYCQCGLMIISEGVVLQASEGLNFETVEGGYSLKGIGTCTDEFLIIPSMYNGKQVVEISSYALFQTYTLKKVFIPSTVSKIGSSAFEYCSAMTDVIFGENSMLSTICEHAFYYSAITSIFLPEGLETLEPAALHSCKSLEEISLPSTLKSIGRNAFRYSSKLSKVYIKDIGTWCNISFDGKYANPAYIAQNIYSTDGDLITSLDIPEGVTYISAFAFYGVKSIERVAFPQSLEKIYLDAFYECSKVSEIHIADLATWCNTYIPSAQSSPGGKLYLNGNELINLSIPDKVSSIGSYVFSGCSSIKTVTMHDSVTNIGEGAFRSCKNLEEITLSNGLVEIPKELLYGNVNLKSITLPNTIIKIGEFAFYSCSSISSVFIPNSVTYIGEYAFDECTAIEEFVFECKQGWKCVYSTGTITIYSYYLETSFNTIKMINEYNYGYWQRA